MLDNGHINDKSTYTDNRIFQTILEHKMINPPTPHPHFTKFPLPPSTSLK